MKKKTKRYSLEITIINLLFYCSMFLLLASVIIMFTSHYAEELSKLPPLLQIGYVTGLLFLVVKLSLIDLRLIK